MSRYIFGYGSLINLSSLSKTLKREMTINDIIPIKLLSYDRLWNLKEKVFSEKLNQNITAIFLNIKPQIDSFVNGVIFEVSDNEFSFLSERERNYSCLNISNQVLPYANYKVKELDIFVFISIENEFIQNSPDKNCYVMKKYIDMVENGCLNIGSFFLTDYNATTNANPFKIIDGTYNFIQTNDESLHK